MHVYMYMYMCIFAARCIYRSFCNNYLLQKKLVLPNMEDLVIPILNSGLPEDKDKITRLTSPS